MGNVKISVCVPVFNAERYVGRCARSLFGQTMTDGVEFIFVDDGSPDAGMDIVRSVAAEFPALNVRLLAHGRNRGLPAARRTAVEAATGDYIAHVDSDDWVEPQYLEMLHAAAVANGAELVLCDYVDHHGDAQRPRRCGGVGKSGLAMSIWNNELPVPIWGKLIARRIFAAHPECLAPDDICYGEDRFTTVRVAFYARGHAFVRRVLYHYECGNDLSMTNLCLPSYAGCMERLWLRTADFFRRARPDGSLDGEVLRGILREKSVIMHFYPMAFKRRLAPLFRDVEMPFVRRLSRGLRLSSALAHYRLWPLLWLMSKYVGWSERRARRKSSF